MTGELIGAGTAGALLVAALVARADSPPSTHGASRWAGWFDTQRLGRPATASRLHGDGMVLGWFHGRLLETPPEDNLLLFGVQRSGKTSAVVVPTLLGWTGAAVATSTKEELVRLTGRHRARRGPVWVFAPLDEDRTWIGDLGLQAATWNPIAEAAGPAAAMELAHIFTAEGGRGDAAHWYLSAANLLAGLFTLEARRGGDLRAVLRTLNLTAPSAYVGLAAASGDPLVTELLNAFAATPEREAGSIVSTARSCLSLWLDPRVAAATAAASEAFRPEVLLERGGTLYLVAAAEEAERCRPLFSAVLQALLREATRRARSSGGVLQPRLLLALDEVANFARIPRLASYVSTGPGQGIQLLLAFHDLGQLEAGYGHDPARTIWNNCRARLLLPGQGDVPTLERFSRAMGDETRLYRTRSWGGGRAGHSEQRIGRPLAAVDVLRRSQPAVLLYAGAPPARLRLRRWDEVGHWRRAVAEASGPRPEEG